MAESLCCRSFFSYQDNTLNVCVNNYDLYVPVQFASCYNPEKFEVFLKRGINFHAMFGNRTLIP